MNTATMNTTTNPATARPTACRRACSLGLVILTLCLAAVVLQPRPASAEPAAPPGPRAELDYYRIHVEFHHYWYHEGGGDYIGNDNGGQGGTFVAPNWKYEELTTSPWNDDTRGSVLWHRQSDGQFHLEFDVPQATIQGTVINRGSGEFNVTGGEAWWAKSIQPTGLGQTGEKGGPLKVDASSDFVGNCTIKLDGYVTYTKR